MSAVVDSDSLLIELIRQEEFLKGQLLIVQRIKKYVMEHAKTTPMSNVDIGDELDSLLRCSESLD